MRMKGRYFAKFPTAMFPRAYDAAALISSDGDWKDPITTPSMLA
jgi:hypothetical protein